VIRWFKVSYHLMRLLFINQELTRLLKEVCAERNQLIEELARCRDGNP
jgi:hypothetical protein